MRGIVVAGAAAAAAGAVALAPRARGATWEEWITRVAESWAGVPSGPLGSVSYDDVRSEWTGPVGLLNRLMTLEGMRIVRGTRVE